MEYYKQNNPHVWFRHTFLSRYFHIYQNVSEITKWIRTDMFMLAVIDGYFNG